MLRTLPSLLRSFVAAAILGSGASTSAAQGPDTTPSPALRAVRVVPTPDYFAWGMLSGAVGGNRLLSIAFTDDRSAVSIGLGVAGIAAFIAKWRAAERVTIPAATPGEARLPSAEEWSATYRSALTDRRRNGLVVGLFTGAALGAALLALSRLPDT